MGELGQGETGHDVLGFVEVLGIVEVEGGVDGAVEERGERVCDRVAEEVGDFLEVINWLFEGRGGGEFGDGIASDGLGGGLLRHVGRVGWG